MIVNQTWGSPGLQPHTNAETRFYVQDQPDG